MKNFCVTVWNDIKKEMTLKVFFEGEKAANEVYDNCCQKEDFKNFEIKLWQYINTNLAPVEGGTFEWCILKSNSIPKL